MEIKKSAKADLESQRNLFLIMGFVTILGFMFITFEWTKPAFIAEVIEVIGEKLATEEELPPPTMENKTVLPPPPVDIPLPPQIEETKEDVKTDMSKLNEPETGPAANYVAPLPPPAAVEEDDLVIIEVAEKMPEYPGGMPAFQGFLKDKLIYPSGAKDAGIQGTVYVSFVVNKDGTIQDVGIAKSVDPELDEEAIRVVKMMPNWIPGEQARKKVRVRFKLPIKFRLQN